MTDFDDNPEETPRQRYRVPAGMPLRDEGRRAGAVVSVVVHAVIIFLLIVPFFMPHSVIERLQQGAGGPGPAGGGGGGTRGTGASLQEHIQFVKVLPAAVPTPKTIPPVLPTLPKPIPKPVPKPVPPKPTPVEIAPAPKVTTTAPAAVVEVASAVIGVGGGSGFDGSSGAGPGSGGGVGSGVGTGRGSATGPGTGGGNAANYPPVPIEFFLPPLPAPSSVRGTRFIAEFDVDSTGRVIAFDFTHTRDGDYNKRISEVLRAMRFKPGTRPNGSPLRMKAQVGYDF